MDMTKRRSLLFLLQKLKKKKSEIGFFVIWYLKCVQMSICT